MRASLLIALAILCACPAWAEIDFNKLADAIYLAEGGKNTKHPYGILAKYKNTTPRQACINTIKHKWRDWKAQGEKGEYLEYLASKYAPIGAKNDPNGLNRNWLKNVRSLYQLQ